MDDIGRKRSLFVFTDLVDPGDDGIALQLLLACKGEFEIHGLVACSGNAWAENVAANLDAFLSHVNRPDIPIFLPISSSRHSKRKEIFEKHEKSCWWNGSYCGALADEILAEQGRSGCGSMADLADLIRSDPDKVVIISLAPLTALAGLLEICPDLANNTKEVLIFGGTLSAPGNVSENAEFNIWFDPDSAESVLHSDLPVTLLPLDALQELSYPNNIELESGSRVHDFLSVYLQQMQLNRASDKPVRVYDEALASIFIDSTLVLDVDPICLSVETTVGPALGKLREIEGSHGRKLRIVRQLDIPRLMQTILN